MEFFASKSNSFQYGAIRAEEPTEGEEELHLNTHKTLPERLVSHAKSYPIPWLFAVLGLLIVATVSVFPSSTNNNNAMAVTESNNPKKLFGTEINGGKSYIPYLDQSNTVSDGTTGGLKSWQSFTLSQDGMLVIHHEKFWKQCENISIN